MTDKHMTTTFTDNLSFSSLSSDYAFSDALNPSSSNARTAHVQQVAGTLTVCASPATAVRRETQPSLLLTEVSTSNGQPSWPTHHERLISGGERFYDDDEDIPLSQLNSTHQRSRTAAATTTSSSNDGHTVVPHDKSGPHSHSEGRSHERLEGGEGGAGTGVAEDSTQTTPSSIRTRQSSSHVFDLGPPTFLHGTHITTPPPQPLLPQTTRSRGRVDAAQDVIPLPLALGAREKEAMSEFVTMATSQSSHASRYGQPTVGGENGAPTPTGSSVSGIRSSMTPFDNNSRASGAFGGPGLGGSHSSKKFLFAGGGSASKKGTGSKDNFEWENVEAYLWAAYKALRTNNDEVMATFKAPKHRMGWYTVIYSVCNNDPSMSWQLYVRLGATIARALEVLVLYPVLERLDQRLVSIKTDANAGTGGDGGSGGGGIADHTSTADSHGHGGSGAGGGRVTSSRRGSMTGTPTESDSHVRSSGSSFSFMRRLFFGNEDSSGSPHHHSGGGSSFAAVEAAGAPSGTRTTTPYATSTPFLVSVAPSQSVPDPPFNVSNTATTAPGKAHGHGHSDGRTSGGGSSGATKKSRKGKHTSGTPLVDAPAEPCQPTSVCATFNEEYDDFAIFQRIVLSCFSYLDQYYAQRFGMDKITTLCIKIFYMAVFEPMRHIILHDLLTRIHRLRDAVSCTPSGRESAMMTAESTPMASRQGGRVGGPSIDNSGALSAVAGECATASGGQARTLLDDDERDANLIADTIGNMCELLVCVQARPSYLITVESVTGGTTTAAAMAMGGSGSARQSPSPAAAVLSPVGLARKISRQSSAASSIVSTPRLGPPAGVPFADGALPSPIFHNQEVSALPTAARSTTGTGGGSSNPTSGAPVVRKRHRFFTFWTRKDDKTSSASRASSQPARHKSGKESKDGTSGGTVAPPPHPRERSSPLCTHSASVSSHSSPGGSARDNTGKADTEAANHGLIEVDLRELIDLRQRLDSPHTIRALGMQAYHFVPCNHMSASGGTGAAGDRAGVSRPPDLGGSFGTTTASNNALFSPPQGGAAPGHPAFGHGSAGGVGGGAAWSASAGVSGVPARGQDTPLNGSVVMAMTASIESLVTRAFAEEYLAALRRYYSAARDAHLRTADGRRTYIAWLRHIWDMEHNFIRRSQLPFLHQAVRRTLTDTLITTVHRDIILDRANGFGALLDIWGGVRGDDGLVAAVLDAPIGAVTTRASVHARHTTTASFSLSTASKLVVAGGATESAAMANNPSRGRAYVRAGEGIVGGEDAVRTYGREKSASSGAVRFGMSRTMNPAPTPVETALAVGQFFWAFTRAEHDESCLLLLASILASRVIAQATSTVRTYVEVIAKSSSASPPSTRTRAASVGGMHAETTSLAAASHTTPLSATPLSAATAAATSANLARLSTARIEAAADFAMEELLMNYQRYRELIDVEMRSHTVMMSALHDALREVLNPHRWTRQGALAASEMRVRAMTNLTNQVGTAGGAWQLPSVLLSKDAGARAMAPLTALARDFPFAASLSTAEMMATYVDHVLQRQFSGTGINASVSPDVEAHFKAIAGLASLLDNKDVFLEHIRLRLARRLLDLARPANLRAEHVLVQAFHGVFTLEGVYSMEAMLRDSFNGESAAAQFDSSPEYAELLAQGVGSPTATRAASGTAPARLEVRVLSCVGWPVQLRDARVRLPASLDRGVRTFEAFYARCHPSRRLRWMHTLARVTLIAELPHGQKELLANMFQAVLLLAISDASHACRAGAASRQGCGVPAARVDGGAGVSGQRVLADRQSPPLQLPQTDGANVACAGVVSPTSENFTSGPLESSFASAMSASLAGAVPSPTSAPLDGESDADDLFTAATDSTMYYRRYLRATAGRRGEEEEEEEAGWITGRQLAARTGLSFHQLQAHLASITLHGPTALVRRLPRTQAPGPNVGSRPEGIGSSLDEPPLTTEDDDDDGEEEEGQKYRDGDATEERGSATTRGTSLVSATPTFSVTVGSHGASTGSSVFLEEEDRFTLNRDFQHPLRRFQLPAQRNGPLLRSDTHSVSSVGYARGADGHNVAASGTKPWVSSMALEVEKSLKASRQVRTDAVLIRIMKSRRTLPFGELMALATEQLAPQFLATNRELKERTSALIERGFLQRSTETDGVLTYIA